MVSEFCTMQEPEFSSKVRDFDDGVGFKLPNPYLAAILTVLAPGLGYAYCGKADKAFLVNSLYIVLFIAVFVLWVIFKFFPPLPFILLFFFYAISLVRHAFYAYQCALRSYSSTGLHRHPLTLLSLAVFSFWLPAILTLLLSQELAFQTLRVTSDVMLPNIRKGDVVLVDKSAYRLKEPVRGDLVMIAERNPKSKARRVFFARIIALPGDSIQLQGALPHVNRQKLTQWHYHENGKTLESQIAVELPFKDDEPLIDVPEQEPKEWYTVLAPRQILFSKTDIFSLGNDSYFVLEDNRSYKTQSSQRQQYGAIIQRSWIKGKPLYVLSNANAEEPYAFWGQRLK